MATGELGADGVRVQRPVGAVPCSRAVHALIQPHRMAAVPVQGPLLSPDPATPHHAKVPTLYCYYRVVVVVVVVVIAVAQCLD